MIEESYRDGPTPEAERQGSYADVTVVADDRSQARVRRNRTTNPMMELFERGSIDEDQYDAAVEISRVAEAISRPAGMRSASLEARVDNSGSAKNLLIEHLGWVRMEKAYSIWRTRLPMPKRMVIDLVTGATTLNTAARRYRMRKNRARTRLVDALNSWIGLCEEMREKIDERDVESAHHRAGGGTLK
jgi:hypothetical protein